MAASSASSVTGNNRYAVARETPSILAMSVARDALVPELACLRGVGVVHLAGASTLPSVRGRSDQSGAGPLDHGVAFELSEGGA